MLRHGAIAGVRPMQGVDLPWIVHAMIGEGSKDYFRAEPARFGDEGFAPKTSPCPAPAAALRSITSRLPFARAHFRQWRHLGQGRRCHPDRPRHRADPRRRKRDGLVQGIAIRENLTLSPLAQFTRGFHLSLKAEGARAMDFIRRLTIKVASPENPFSSLSGGNQQ